MNTPTGNRVTLDTLPEDCLWPAVKFADRTAASADVTRKNAYVELATNADLDLGAGLEWAIRDAADTDLFKLTENAGGSATTLLIGADVDVYDNNALANDFATGATINSGGTRPIAVGETDGVIESTSGDLRVNGTAESLLDDGNQAGSTWVQTAGIKLSEDTTEWDTFETYYGEVSLLNALNQAFTATGTFNKTCANVTSTTTSDTDVGGVADGANLDAQLHDLSNGTFVDDHDIILEWSTASQRC